MVLGQNDLIHFHHLANKSKQSNTVRDSIFYETFMCFCVRIIWIAMHRKAYSTIGTPYLFNSLIYSNLVSDRFL